jgi:hypothetical protein
MATSPADRTEMARRVEATIAARAARKPRDLPERATHVAMRAVRTALRRRRLSAPR